MEEILNKKYEKLQDENIELTDKLLNSDDDYTIIMLNNKIRWNRVLIKKLKSMKEDLK